MWTEPSNGHTNAELSSCTRVASSNIFFYLNNKDRLDQLQDEIMFCFFHVHKMFIYVL